MSKHSKIVPHLVVKGGLEAIMIAEDGQRIMHAELDITDSTVFLCDEFPEFSPATTSPAAAGDTPVIIHLELKKPKHVDRMIAQTEDRGAEVIMPAMDAQAWRQASCGRI
jgi:PhnB protein